MDPLAETVSNDKNDTYDKIYSIMQNDKTNEWNNIYLMTISLNLTVKQRHYLWCTGFPRCIKIQLDQDLL